MVYIGGFQAAEMKTSLVWEKDGLWILFGSLKKKKGKKKNFGEDRKWKEEKKTDL